MSATEIKRTKDSCETLLRNARLIRAGLKTHLMFRETDRTGFGTDFRRAIETMFELTNSKDGYYHYYVAKESFNYEFFVIAVLPLLDCICIPAQRLTWEEFEARFDEFVGGTVVLQEFDYEPAPMTIIGFELVDKGNDPFLWVNVPPDQLPEQLMMKPFWLHGDHHEPGPGFAIFYHELRNGIEDLGMTPFDHHDGTIGMSKFGSSVTFHLPHH